MKKTFPLQSPGKDDARVRDKIRHEVNKAVRRQQQRPLPEGFRRWDFTCRVGATEAETTPQPLAEVGSAIDAVAQTGASTVYIEIVATPGQRAAAR